MKVGRGQLADDLTKESNEVTVREEKKATRTGGRLGGCSTPQATSRSYVFAAKIQIAPSAGIVTVALEYLPHADYDKNQRH